MTNLEDRGSKIADEFGDKPLWAAFKWGVGLILVITALVLVISVISTGSVFFNAAKAKITAAPRVTSKIYETENIISKVALFHDKCNKVVADLKIFQNNYGRYLADKQTAVSATGLERTSAEQSLSNDISDYTAPLNVVQEDAANYNSASAQYTQNPFKAQNLPYRIEIPAGASAVYAAHIECH